MIDLLNQRFQGTFDFPLRINPEKATVVKQILRYVPLENYTTSFGLQWNTYSLTQLDSYTGTTISKDRLTRLAGGSLDIFEGKNVLEAGCGAGRFTELMLNGGARVFAVDMSSAVEANYQNHKDNPNYFVCQADIQDIPVEPEQFDIVVCIGVIQHTPDPELTMAALCSHVKPGGLIIIDHYTYGYATTRSRRVLRSFLLKRSSAFSLRFCMIMVQVLWVFHRLLWQMVHLKHIGGYFYGLRRRFLEFSPVVDYHDAYSQLGATLLRTWAILDTHDTLTDVYKHLRSSEELANHLAACGMTEIETTYAGNGVEARARKPIKE